MITCSPGAGIGSGLGAGVLLSCKIWAPSGHRDHPSIYENPEKTHVLLVSNWILLSSSVDSGTDSIHREGMSIGLEGGQGARMYIIVQWKPGSIKFIQIPPTKSEREEGQ